MIIMMLNLLDFDTARRRSIGKWLCESILSQEINLERLDCTRPPISTVCQYARHQQFYDPTKMCIGTSNRLIQKKRMLLVDLD